MCILRFAYAHCICSLFDYEIVRACNGALHVMVNVDALVRDIGISSLVFSRSLFAVVARRGRRDHLLRNFRTRNCARREGQRSVRHGGIICDGSRIRSFAREGNNGQD